MTEPTLNIGKIDTPRQFHQLGIFVLDGSGSMNDQTSGNIRKADAVNMAVRELLTRFKVSRVKKNFSFAVVNFDTKATIKTEVTPADQIDDNDNYDPMIGHGGGTAIYAGLEEAEKIANDFLNSVPAEGVPHSVIILLMTDGECFKPDRTLEVADKIKNGQFASKIIICTTFLGTLGVSDIKAEDLLKDIATDKVMGFKKVYDAETLRTFFEKSISAASGGIQLR